MHLYTAVGCKFRVAILGISMFSDRRFWHATLKMAQRLTSTATSTEGDTVQCIALVTILRVLFVVCVIVLVLLVLILLVGVLYRW